MLNLKIRVVLYGFACCFCLFGAGYLGWVNLPKSTLAEVKARGYLRCGVNGTLPGFSVQKTDADEDGYYSAAEGFDADFCRVIAIAIFGTAEGKVQFLNLTSRIGTLNERFLALRNGKVDVLLRNTSWTPSRDAEQNVDFGAITFYSYQTFLVRKKSNIKKLADLAGKTICVLPGTTTGDNLEILRETIPLEPVTERNTIDFESNQDASDAFFTNYCDALTSDYEQLRANLANSPNREDYEILAESVSDEMIGPAVRENDSQWRDVVNYAVWTTQYAEQQGITQKNVNQFDESSSLSVKVFLGIDDPRITRHLGNKLGLPPDFAQKIIEQIGNYEDIYQRNLGDILPERGLNQLWVLNHQGRLFAPPFVADQIPTPSPGQ